VEPSSSRVLSFTEDLVGLDTGGRFKLSRAVWVLSKKHPNSADDIVQAVALRGWTNHLFRRGTNTGDLIAAANRAVADRRS
jgi:hypothetical protein